MLRACRECGALSQRTRCPLHTSQRAKARDASRPGHRAEHARMRRLLAPSVLAGTPCPRCGERVYPPWDADHLPSGAWAASHQYCNRAAH